MGKEVCGSLLQAVGEGEEGSDECSGGKIPCQSSEAHGKSRRRCPRPLRATHIKRGWSCLIASVRNPDFYIKKPFLFVAAYQLISSKTTLLDAVGATTKDEEGKEERVERVVMKEKNACPFMVEVAKKQKFFEHREPSTVEKSASYMSISVSRIEKVLLLAQEVKKNISERKLKLKERKFEWELSKELFGPGSDASEGDRWKMRQLMRKCILLQLSSKQEICNGEGVNSTARMLASYQSPKQTERNKSMVTRSWSGEVLGREET
ncbi:hypothetical protein BWQ96_02185 [Gracilariopsis chorda]|uniref:Uncharacterized protein n=1 Tax=Gracilariopsis chorda TaxID=448386 RepID=A0A2V3J0U2_9FLOR|nr:hypothetical protein BWQ96_02185 [Gracilariopsis chorda]|eukprot:PXF47994.1 hypothetical protein BWQ96_02185 [Gracilariopsis chorda]